MKPLLMGVAAFLATAAGIAVAQDMGPPPPGGAVTRADANGDGVVTRDEFVAQAIQRFDRIDANRDGRLDKGELERIGRGPRGMRGEMPPPPPPSN